MFSTYKSFKCYNFYPICFISGVIFQVYIIFILLGEIIMVKDE
jgi:hypothetical protein